MQVSGRRWERLSRGKKACMIDRGWLEIYIENNSFFKNFLHILVGIMG